MRKLLFVALCFSLNCSVADSQSLPPFVFPELDQAAVGLWLAANDAHEVHCNEYLLQMEEWWEATRPVVADFPITAYNPAHLVSTLDEVLLDVRSAVKHPDYEEVAGLTYHFMWEFSIVRSFHRQQEYPLDALWEISRMYQEIAYAIHDPQLGLLEWQELTCMFDEFRCRLDDYEQRAEAYLTLYCPQVDEDAHKSTMLRMYTCVDTFAEELENAFRPDLVWPCDDMGMALQGLFQLYAGVEVGL